MTAPTIPAEFADLTQAPVATLATVGADDRPQLSAVWFVIDDEGIRISLNNTRQKTRNLQANPAATLFILDPSGARYVEIRGDVTLTEDRDYAFADQVGAKYGGADLRQMDGPGEFRYVVTLQPTRVNTVDMTKH